MKAATQFLDQLLFKLALRYGQRAQKTIDRFSRRALLSQSVDESLDLASNAKYPFGSQEHAISREGGHWDRVCHDPR